MCLIIYIFGYHVFLIIDYNKLNWMLDKPLSRQCPGL
jgi:hypothetical protein